METLQDLIDQGEHVNQDFKFRIDDQRKIARTLCAFANTSGGRLLIGVKDNRKIVGCNPEEEFHMLEGAASMFCQPEINITSKIWQEDFRLVLEIQVEKNLDRNHTALDEEGKWKIYIRKDDHTLLANKILLKVWNLEKKGLPKPQHFGKEELDFLKTLSNERRTLSQLYRLNTIPKIQVDQLLSLFVYWKIIQMEMSEEGSFYSII